MSDKPIYSSQALEIATDINFAAAGDDVDDSPVKIQPSLAELRQGMRPGRQFGGQYRNWLDRQFAALLSALIEDQNHDEDELAAYRVEMTTLLAARRAEWMHTWGSLPALNFGAPVTVNGINRRLRYVPELSTWFGVGATNTGRSSATFGRAWTDLALPAGGRVSHDIDVTPTGLVAIANNGSATLDVRSPTNLWSAPVLPGGVVADRPSVRYDSVHALWVVVHGSGTGPKVFTSPDAAAWTARTTPAEFGGPSTDNLLALNPASGRLVWLHANTNAGALRWATSDDGGMTWTPRGEHLIGGGSPPGLSLRYDELLDMFVCAWSRNGVSRVLRSSTQGESFAEVGAVGVEIGSLGTVGALYCAAAGAFGDIVFSPDAGATWRYGGHRLGAAANVFAGGGGFLAATASSVTASLRLYANGPLVPPAT